jgi:hypothetical protein
VAYDRNLKEKKGLIGKVQRVSPLGFPGEQRGLGFHPLSELRIEILSILEF